MSRVVILLFCVSTLAHGFLNNWTPASRSIASGSPIFSIDHFGAIPHNESIAAARANGKALFDAIQAAHNSPNKSVHQPAVVLVPGCGGCYVAGTEGECRVYTFVPHDIVIGIDNVVLQLEGTINAFAGDMNLWPNVTHPKPYEHRHILNVIDIRFSENITLQGKGCIQGNGEHWWFYVLETGSRNSNRPFLVWLENVKYTTVRDWTMRNGPSHHFRTHDALYGLVENVTIFVEVTIQKALMKRKWLELQQSNHHSVGKWVVPGPFGAVALNTDGIDIAGQYWLVKDCYVQNYDDALCTKPQDQNGNLTKCTKFVTFENSRIHYGVGASVGSVPPTPAVNCIEDVVYRNIHFKDSLKSIYIKPNPGDLGRGIINNILYENIYMEDCMWWSIWVSTQQQDQPGNHSNTGCSFLYPLPGTKCPLQPRVPVTNLTLRNITSVRAWLSPGVLRCSDEGPCTGWNWTDVSVTSLTNWPSGNGFLCHGIENRTQWKNVTPGCIAHSTQSLSDGRNMMARLLDRFFD